MIQKTFLLLATASVLALSACAGDSAQTPPTASTPPTMQTAPGTIPPMGAATAPMTTETPAPTDLLNAPLTTVPAAPSTKSDVEARLSRLESDMNVMKGQIQLVAPILEKMPALQDKLSELVAELQRIDARVSSTKQAGADAPVVTDDKKPAPMAPIIKPAPKMSPVISPAPKPSAPAKSAKPIAAPEKHAKSTEPAPMTAAPAPSTPSMPGKRLTDVRVGDDAEKTRVVLDVATDTPFQYDLDNTEKILIIDLDTPVTSSKMGTLDKSPLVASYATQSISPDKSRVILQLRAPVQVLKTSTLPPNDEKGHRVVIDLAPAAH